MTNQEPSCPFADPKVARKVTVEIRKLLRSYGKERFRNYANDQLDQKEVNCDRPVKSAGAEIFAAYEAWLPYASGYVPEELTALYTPEERRYFGRSIEDAIQSGEINY